jgi:hypothetical protein
MARDYDKDYFHFPRESASADGHGTEVVILPSGDGPDYDIHLAPDGPRRGADRQTLRKLAAALDRWHEMDDADIEDLERLVAGSGWHFAQLAVGPRWD